VVRFHFTNSKLREKPFSTERQKNIKFENPRGLSPLGLVPTLVLMGPNYEVCSCIKMSNLIFAKIALETSSTAFVFTRQVCTAILAVITPHSKNVKTMQISIGPIDRAHKKLATERISSTVL